MKKIRYINKQPNKWSCGPVAIINALKWAGAPIKLIDLPTVAQICNSLPEDGTYYPEQDQALKVLGKNWIKTRKFQNPTVKQMLNILKKDRAIIMLYWDVSNGHCVFIPCLEKNQLVVINDKLPTESFEKRNWSIVKLNTLVKRGCLIWEIKRYSNI